MATDDKIRDEKLQCDINREVAKIYRDYYLEKCINMNILQVNKYCLLIKEVRYNKLRLLVLL